MQRQVWKSNPGHIVGGKMPSTQRHPSSQARMFTSILLFHFFLVLESLLGIFDAVCLVSAFQWNQDCVCQNYMSPDLPNWKEIFERRIYYTYLLTYLLFRVYFSTPISLMQCELAPSPCLYHKSTVK